MNEREYEVRADWDCGQQLRALRSLLVSIGCSTEVAVEIDDIYRPALETREWQYNEARGVAHEHLARALYIVDDDRPEMEPMRIAHWDAGDDVLRRLWVPVADRVLRILNGERTA